MEGLIKGITSGRDTEKRSYWKGNALGGYWKGATMEPLPERGNGWEGYRKESMGGLLEMEWVGGGLLERGKGLGGLLEGEMNRKVTGRGNEWDHGVGRLLEGRFTGRGDKWEITRVEGRLYGRGNIWEDYWKGGMG